MAHGLRTGVVNRVSGVKLETGNGLMVAVAVGVRVKVGGIGVRDGRSIRVDVGVGEGPHPLNRITMASRKCRQFPLTAWFFISFSPYHTINYSIHPN